MTITMADTLLDDALPLSMKEVGRYNGLAPIIATSLIVSCTDRLPMSPLAKNKGETTWLSVAITSRPVACCVQSVSLNHSRITSCRLHSGALQTLECREKLLTLGNSS